MHFLAQIDAGVANEETPALEGGVPTTPGATVESVWNTLLAIWKDFVEHLPLLCAGLGLLVATWLVVRLFGFFSTAILGRFKLRGSLRQLVGRLVTIGIWVTGLLTAAMVVFPGVTPGRALATLGLGSIAIGFAFKDIFENFFAGVLILWRFPFEAGDFIECGGIVGKVEDVTIRNTLIRRTTGELVVVPNAQVFKSPVDVLTNWDRRRVTVVCGVAYKEDVKKSRETIEAALRECKSVDVDRPVEIFAQEFADSSINFEVTWWTEPTPRNIRESRDEVVTAVKAALDDAGIEIPFPYRTLTFNEPLSVVSNSKSEVPSDAG